MIVIKDKCYINEADLTTKEIEEIIEDKNNHISIYAKLVDKFGDNGITTCLIASVENSVANIDLWVMSCRVFKRHLEYAMFDYLVEKCRQMGIQTITASYIPSAKNIIIKDFYESIGFELISETDKEKRYVFNGLKDYEIKNKVIKLEQVQEN